MQFIGKCHLKGTLTMVRPGKDVSLRLARMLENPLTCSTPMVSKQDKVLIGFDCMTLILML